MVIRDATHKPKPYKKRAAVEAIGPIGLEPKVAQPATSLQPQPWTDAKSSKRRIGPGRQHSARVRAQEAANVKRRVEEIGAALSAPADVQPAAQRLEQFGRRVRRRLGLDAA